MKILIKPLDQLSSREFYLAARLREEVFVAEQKITVSDLDQTDLTAIQLLVLNEAETAALATCRAYQDAGKWFFGRVAVAKTARGQGLGSEMIKRLAKYLAQKGASALYCHAQLQAKPFYDRLGFKPQGAEFMEAGIPHVLMVKDLADCR